MSKAKTYAPTVHRTTSEPVPYAGRARALVVHAGCRVAPMVALLTSLLAVDGCAFAKARVQGPDRAAAPISPGPPASSTRRTAEPPVPFACDWRAIASRRAPHTLMVELAEKTTVYPHAWPNRNRNLATASRYLCGRLLAPGATLSFNQTIGETTPERGYDYGPTFVGNRVVPGLGGGVCQVASTLYDAARFAAIRVVERHPHGMRVPYVAPGEDATVSSPYLDLVIANSTRGPLLVAAGARGPAVRIALFGPTIVGHGHFEHRILAETPYPTIRIADPKLPQGTAQEVQEGVPGVVAHTWYVITTPDGRVRRYDLGVDRYRPSPHILRVGTQVPPAPPGGSAAAGNGA